MGKSRTGAGNSCSTLYKCNTNLNTHGGNKKQGITSRVGLDHWDNREIQSKSNGIGRFKLICMNQLGGIGTGYSMFGGRWSRADGMKTCKIINGIDFSGYNTICGELGNSNSQIFYVDNKIQITNADNLESITTIILNVLNNSVFIPVKYESGTAFTIQLPQPAIDYLFQKLTDKGFQFPIYLSIKPCMYFKKNSTAVFNFISPNVGISTNPADVFHGSYGLQTNSKFALPCPDTIHFNNKPTGHLFLIDFSKPTMNVYLYYTLAPLIGTGGLPYMLTCS